MTPKPKMKVYLPKILLLCSQIVLTTSSSVQPEGRQLFSFGSQNNNNSNGKLRKCTTPSGGDGFCQDVTNCPALLLDFRTLVQSICFQSFFRPGTCCPVKTTPDATTKPTTTTITTTESPTTTTTALTTTTTKKDTGFKKVTPAKKEKTTTTTPPTTVKATTGTSQSASSSTSTLNPPKDTNVGGYIETNLGPPHFYPIPSNRPPPGTRYDCGVPKATQARVVNGTESYPGQWPWMVAIYLHGFLGSEFHCGGTLISREYVITAAHCMIDKRGRRFSPSQFSVRLGDHDISTKNDIIDNYVRTVKVQSIQIHEDFENFNHQYFRNDIALLKLSRAIDFSPYILPICLPSKAMAKAPVDSLSGEIATVIGYGRTSYSGPQSKMLLKAAMPVWWNKACDDAYFPPILETNVCAGYVEGGVDSCQGDSGGPLLIYRHGKWVLLGIVSFGQKCAEPGYPGVYTRVPKFLEWIQKKAQN